MGSDSISSSAFFFGEKKLLALSLQVLLFVFLFRFGGGGTLGGGDSAEYMEPSVVYPLSPVSAEEAVSPSDPTNRGLTKELRKRFVEPPIGFVGSFTTRVSGIPFSPAFGDLGDEGEIGVAFFSDFGETNALVNLEKMEALSLFAFVSFDLLELSPFFFFRCCLVVSGGGGGPSG